MNGSAKILRAIALALAAWFALLLLYVFARRFVYPYDLEWMEGGMLDHALRLAHGQPIYAPPSVDFIPYLYTPGYPFAVFVLGKLFGIGYRLGRFVSLLGFFTVVVLGYVYARREGGSRAAAACAIAIIFGAFVPTGTFYDLARPDSLFMGLVTAGLLIGWWKRHSYGGGVAAALLLVAAFFVKQTSSVFMPVLGLALLLAVPRTAVVYGLTLAVVGLPSLWLSNRASGGWFWTYVSVLHRKHDFFPARAFLGTPGRLALILGPAILLVPWALVRRRTPGLVYATFIALAGIGAACVSFGTQWAFTNAFMPGVMLPAIAIGVAAGRLLDDTREAPPRLRSAAVYLLLALSHPDGAGGPAARRCARPARVVGAERAAQPDRLRSAPVHPDRARSRRRRSAHRQAARRRRRGAHSVPPVLRAPRGQAHLPAPHGRHGHLARRHGRAARPRRGDRRSTASRSSSWTTRSRATGRCGRACSTTIASPAPSPARASSPARRRSRAIVLVPNVIDKELQ